MSADHDSSPNNPQVTSGDAPVNDWLKEAACWWSQALSAAGAGFRARLDSLAKRGAADAPERVSPDLFNQHVADDLLAVIRAWAGFVRLDMAGYAEALDACLAYAWRRGAWGFSPVHLEDLQDWISDQLSLAVDPPGGPDADRRGL